MKQSRGSQESFSENQDRRRKGRVCMMGRLMLDVQYPPHKRVIKRFGCDLSNSGLRFMTQEPLVPLRPLLMTLYLSPEFPGNHEIKPTGKVIRKVKPANKPYSEISCQFDGCGFDTRAVIQNFLRWSQIPAQAEALQ